MSTVLVTGASGLLGRQVLVAFKDANWTTVGTGFSRTGGTDLRKLDINNSSSIEQILDEIKPKVIVHCAAERSPDKVSADPEAAKKLNVQATEVLAQASTSRGILIIYISTDYVFPGKEGEAPYEADATTSPPNLYGQTKLDGELATLNAAGSLAVVLRVPVLYGTAENNTESAINTLVDSVLKAQEKEAKISMDDWAQRYPTNTEDVSRVIKDIAEKYTSTNGSELPRILQFSSEDRYTKYEICQVLAEILGVPIDRITANKQGNDPNSSTQRPYDTHLSTKALQQVGIPTWTQNFKDWWKWQLNAIRH